MNTQINNRLATEFKRFVPYDNVLTPKVKGYFENGLHIVELTEGVSMDNEPMFGVTTIWKSDGERDRKFSELFFSESEARSFIRNKIQAK